MRLFPFAFAVIVLVGFSHLAQAQSFTDSLAKAYLKNPELAAAQAELRAVDTSVAEAQSGWRPTVAADGSIGYSESDAGGGSTTRHPKDVGVSVTQPIFSGGQTIAGTKIAKSNVRAQRAALLNTEQSILLSSATAYLDVIRQQAIVELNANNVSVLEEDVRSSRNRYDVGEITRTDVSQSESRRARAEADRILAEGNLNISRATYVRLVGEAPQNLESPTLDLDLPKTLEETIAEAEKNNPLVVAALYNEKAAMSDIDFQRGSLLPDVSVTASKGRSWNDGTSVATGNNVNDTTAVVGTVTIPLYTAGADYARLSGSRERATQRKLQLDNARNVARETAVSAWASLNAAKASLEARDSEVKAAELALAGVRRERTVGTRTVLDMLDSEQELLNARVNRIQSERDMKVAKLQVMAAIGKLTAQNLKLPVAYYNPKEHYRDVDGSWFGG